jgi:hypothetical protein
MEIELKSDVDCKGEPIFFPITTENGELSSVLIPMTSIIGFFQNENKVMIKSTAGVVLLTFSTPQRAFDSCKNFAMKKISYLQMKRNPDLEEKIEFFDEEEEKKEGAET